MKQLDHKPRKSFERTRNPHGRADFDEHAFGGVDEDLKLPCFVHRRIEEGQEALPVDRNQLKYMARTISLAANLT